MCNVSGDASSASVSSDKEGADVKGSAPEWLDDPHFDPHLRPRAVCSDWKSNISDTGGRNSFAGSALQKKVRRSFIG